MNLVRNIQALPFGSKRSKVKGQPIVVGHSIQQQKHLRKALFGRRRLPSLIATLLKFAPSNFQPGLLQIGFSTKKKL